MTSDAAPMFAQHTCCINHQLPSCRECMRADTTLKEAVSTSVPWQALLSMPRLLPFRAQSQSVQHMACVHAFLNHCIMQRHLRAQPGWLHRRKRDNCNACASLIALPGHILPPRREWAAAISGMCSLGERQQWAVDGTMQAQPLHALSLGL